MYYYYIIELHVIHFSVSVHVNTRYRSQNIVFLKKYTFYHYFPYTSAYSRSNNAEIEKKNIIGISVYISYYIIHVLFVHVKYDAKIIVPNPRLTFCVRIYIYK